MDQVSLVRELPLEPLCGALRSGTLSPRDLVDDLCKRLDAIEGRLRSLVPETSRRDRLEREARALEARFPDPQGRPALYGVPVAIKDIISVEGLPTRAGSPLPAEDFATPEASCVARLRGAGALVLGKSVTTQFAYLDPGATVNPHNPKHTPGGSSSGSAAAVAAAVSPLALGTQTAGSVNRPAGFCGVVGFKPSFGRIPTDGILACAPSYDTVGAFTQDIAGMTIACETLFDDWRGHVGGPRERPVLGVPEGPYLDQMQPAGRAAFEKQLAQLRRASFEIVRVHCLAEIEEVASRHRNLMSVEFARAHAERFLRYGPLYGPQAAMLIDRAQSLGPGADNPGRRGRGELRDELHEVIDRGGFDLFIAPATPGPAPSGLHSTGDARMNVPWTQSGLPCLSLPAGRARSGLPLGVQLIGRFARDEELLGWAVAIEAALRVAPSLEAGRDSNRPENIRE